MGDASTSQAAMDAFAALDNPSLTSSTLSAYRQRDRTSLRVAVAEGDPGQRQLLVEWLSRAGHRCSQFDWGDALIRACAENRFDAVLLDGNLRGISAVEVLKHVRTNRRGWVPVVLVGARNSEDEIVTALRQGADDYLIKPVRQLELLARLEALARRGERWNENPPALEVDAFLVDLRGRVLLRHAQPVQLTAKDFDLAVLLLSNIGRLLSRNQIRERVWSPATALTSRSLDTHVCRVRSKLGLTPENGWTLSAVYRNGYRLSRLGKAEAGSLAADAGEPQR